jgi:hypothetical protein
MDGDGFRPPASVRKPEPVVGSMRCLFENAASLNGGTAVETLNRSVASE